MNKPVDRPPLIRLAVSADAEALSALILRTIRESNAEDYPPDEIERVCASFTPEEVAKQIAARDVFVSFAPGSSQEPPIGTVSLGVKPRLSGGETAKLHVLFVAPEWQGRGLGLRLVAHLETHASSDDCGVRILGGETNKFWHDHKGAKVNAVRTRTLIGEADVVVVRFGEKYKQWNAAFDAGYASALGKPLIVLHPPEHAHALKEVDAAALAVAEEPEQVAQILDYAITGRLPAA